MIPLLHRYPFWPLLRPHKRAYAFGVVWLLIVDAINVALPVLVGWAIDALSPVNLSTVTSVAIAYFLLMALQSVGRYLWRWYLIGSSHRIAANLRTSLFAHLLKLPYRSFSRLRTGDLMARATGDIESVRMAVGPGVLISLDAIFLFVLIFPAMCWLSPRLTLFTILFFPLVPVITAVLGKKIDRSFGRLQEHLAEMSTFAQESFAGIRWVKSLVLEPVMETRFLALSGRYRVEGQRLAKFEGVFSPGLGLITNLGTWLLLVVGVNDVLSGAITVGTFVAFQRFVVQLSWPMEAVGWVVTLTREGAAAYRRLEGILTLPEVVSALASAEVDGAKKSDEPVLHIQNLRLPKPNEGKPFLRIANLSVEPGKKIGIVGAVGSGKSLFLNALLRIYEVEPGSIFLFGRDLTSIPLTELRQTVGSVEQQVFLFSESVDANLKMGSGVIPTDAELWHALRVSAIDKEIEALGQSQTTVLGERGVNLSGGQKQRLALARALLRKPKLLLLDDALSAVDAEVEDRIIRSFMNEFGELAVIFSSHRLSIMPQMDEVWVLADGEIAARGNHRELMARCKMYQDLWQQAGKSA